ncbi:HEAT repeat domain-containing protein [Nostoc sp.]|uniref:HEAT repeat domain-containing protein n=1 Tax=Nostoc sp. TaxID=1180 RepID=UPI002FFBB464
MGTGNPQAIAALEKMLQSTDIDGNIHIEIAESLGKIDTGNDIAIAALVQLLQSTTVNDSTRWQAAESLEKILQDNKHRFEVVKALSGYWQLDNDCYDLTWNCAQNMPYPDFYQACHQRNLATRVMQSLKKILFTRII